MTPSLPPSALPWRVLAAIFTAVVLATVATSPVVAEGKLDSGAVSPPTVTVGTPMAFSVVYDGTGSPSADALEVWADAVRASDGFAVRIDLALDAGGTPLQGTWRSSQPLPVGTWQVTFRATAEKGPSVAPYVLGSQVIVSGASPSPSPPPTPSPTDEPPDPTSTPRPTPRPSNRPATPRPSSPSGPDQTQAPPQAPSSPGTADPTAAGASATPSGADAESAAPDHSRRPGSSPGSLSPSPSHESSTVSTTSSGSVTPWLVLGGGMATTGAGVLAWQWLAWRRRPH